METETQMKVKEQMRVPKDEKLQWAFLTSARILFGVGIIAMLLTMQEVGNSQIAYAIFSIVVFITAGWLEHSYSKWLAEFGRSS